MWNLSTASLCCYESYFRTVSALDNNIVEMTETEDKDKMGETETDASKLDDSADGVQEKGEKEKPAVKISPFKVIVKM